MEKIFEFTKVTVCEGALNHIEEPGEVKTGFNNQIVEFLCPCGCGETIYLTTKEWCEVPGKNWTIDVKDGKVTLWPSINATGFECKSHFFVKDNKIQWV